jgi:hypothetical protein
MNERTTILRQPGRTRWVVFEPDDNRFMFMRLVCGISGEVLCQWSVMKKDVPLMISSWEADKYRIINY